MEAKLSLSPRGPGFWSYVGAEPLYKRNKPNREPCQARRNRKRNRPKKGRGATTWLFHLMRMAKKDVR